MFRLIESIRLHNGEFNNLTYHEERIYRGMRQIFGVDRRFNLMEELGQYDKPGAGLFKCRLAYNNKMKHVEFIPYTIRPVRSLKICTDDSLSYDHKFEDRKDIDNVFKERRTCDDVLIVKNGCVTDTSNANIAFRRGTAWVTPVSCLLPGTMRQNLLDKKLIAEENIRPENLSEFEAFKIMNAMVLFDMPEVPVENIVP